MCTPRHTERRVPKEPAQQPLVFVDPLEHRTHVQFQSSASALRLVTKLNGAVMQDASTRDMTFDVPTLISELSRGITIPAGTVILTGTPSGVGMSRKPPVWLKQGDVVEVSISATNINLGTLVNRIVIECHEH